MDTKKWEEVLQKQATATANRAIQLDEKGENEKAFDLYFDAAQKLMLLAKMPNIESTKRIYRKSAADYIKRAEQLRDHFAGKKADDKNEDGNNASGKAGLVGANGKAKSGEGDEENRKLRNALSDAILQDRPNVQWEDIAGLEAAKEALKEAVVLPIMFPQMFVGPRQPWRGILLYGPPGTGKSHLAKAVATQVNCTFFSVSSSNLVSKWLGESEKLVRLLFSMARENKPSVIFIDEIDALCSPRGEGESEASRRIKTEILVQMDGVGNDSKGVLVLGATNVPKHLDAAIRRRFQRRIHIGLPDASARARMFKLAIGDFPTSLTPADIQELASKSEGYSGSDISIVVQDALMRPVSKVMRATHFKEVKTNEGVKLTPCSPGDPHAKEMTFKDVKSDQLLEPAIQVRDFFSALNKVTLSNSGTDLQQYAEFTKEFGSEGA